MNQVLQKSNSSDFAKRVLPPAFLAAACFAFLYLFQYRFSFDGFWEFLPFRIFARHCLAQGVFPAWMPNIFCGFPIWAEGESGIANPFNLLVGGTFSYLLFQVAVLFCTGFFSALYMRRMGATFGSSWLLALPCVFSPTTFYWFSNSNNLFLIALFPLMLYLAEGQIRNPSIPAIIRLGLVMGLTLLAGHPQIALFELITLGMYALVRTSLFSGSVKMKAGTMMGFAISAIIGIGVGAIQILPLWEMVGETIFPHIEVPEAGQMQDFLETGSLNFSLIGHLLFPKTYDFDLLGEVNFLPYLGLTPLLFALLARPNRSMITLWMLTVLVFILSLGHNTPLYDLLSTLPGFSMLRKSYWFVAFMPFFLCAIAALGLSRQILPTSHHRRLPILLMALYAVIFLWASLLLLSERFSPLASTAHHPWLGFFVIATISVMAVFLIRAWRSLPVWVGIALLITVDLFSYGLWRQPVEPISILDTAAISPSPEAEFASALPVGRNRLLRVHEDYLTAGITQSDALPSSSLDLVFGSNEFWGWEEPSLKPATTVQVADAFLKGRIFLPFLDRASVHVIRSDFPLSGDLELVQRIDGDFIYRNANALPKAYLAGPIINVADSDQVIKALENIETGTVVIGLEQASQGNELSPVSIQVDKPGLAQFEIDLPQSSLLVLNETFYKGWTATIDGRQAEIYRTNFLFMGVAVPEGRHRVTFAFQSPPLRHGKWITGLTLILCTLLILPPFLRKKAARDGLAKNATET